MNDLQQAVVTASLEIHQRQDRVTAARRLCDFLSLPTPVPDDKVAVAAVLEFHRRRKAKVELARQLAAV